MNAFSGTVDDVVRRARRSGLVAATAELRLRDADVLLLSALLVLMAIGGKPFAKISLAPHLYPTEVLLAATAVAALLRNGVRKTLRRLAVLPLWAIGLYWLAGGIAALRGLRVTTASAVLRDVGLVEYSVILVIVAAVIDSRERVFRLGGALLVAGVVATGVYLVVYGFFPQSTLGGVDNPGSGVGIYVSLAVLPALVALVHGRRAALLLALPLAVGATLVSMTVSRGSLVALVAGLAATVLLAPRGRRLLGIVLAAATLALSIGGAALATRLQNATASSPAVAVAVVVANPNYIADDGGTGAVGGTPVRGNAASGAWSRRVPLGGFYYLPHLTNLVPGRPYTVVFWAKPVYPIASGGAVGETAGTGWGMQRWAVAPTTTWQRMQAVLVPTASTQRLVIAPDFGSPSVLIDGLRVVKGRLHGRSGNFRLPTPIASPGFDTDDAETALVGGLPVVGTAASGKVSRHVRRGETVVLSGLHGLAPGREYTVSFSARPLGTSATSGVLTVSGGGRTVALPWQARGPAWSRVTLHVQAPAAVDSFALTTRTDFLVDALAVEPGHRGVSTPPPPAAPPARGIVTTRPASTVQPQGTVKAAPATVVGAFADSLDPTTVSGDNANARWRLAYWHFLLDRTFHEPLLGAGFGRGADFSWHGIVYDARAGNPNDGNDVTPPHNSFVNILYRSGLLGFLPLVALVAIALLRTIKALRSPLDPQLRVLLVAAASCFVFAGVTACLNVALEGPYMGVFFWSLLALLLVAPRAARRSEPEASGG